MKADVSVIICAHNPRPQYLQRVLDALRGQTLALDQWELLLVDNASEEPLNRDWDLSWHPHARHVFEEQLGLSIARQCGMRAASAEIIVFVDDDNVLDANYLAEAVRIGREWPLLGAFGGSIKPEFEVEPSQEIRDFLGFLALREINTQRWTNVPDCGGADPWGAGLCVRKIVASAYQNYYCDSLIKLPGRSGGSLVSGEDTEICYVACSLGLGVGLFPELKLTHLIPGCRFDRSYLARLIEGIETSVNIVRFNWHGTIPANPFAGLGLLRVVANVLTRRGMERRGYIARLKGTLKARETIEAISSTLARNTDNQFGFFD